MIEKNKKIAKNTIILYFRMLFIALISFYTVRVLLDTLGIEDYGIYNVVGGIVALSSFIPATLSSATQRYFSFAIGENKKEKLEEIFSTNLVIYIGIVIVAIILLETIGLWFVKEYLKIPEEKVDIVIVLFHLSILTFSFSILTSPFIAIMISYEDMNIYSYLSIFDAFMKLFIVFLLPNIPFNGLEVYGWLLLLSSLITMSLYILISHKKYSECQFRKLYFNRSLIKEILSFTSWTMFGSLSTVVRNNGVTILLNQMFNPSIVASRAIASQIVNFTNIFAQNLNTALYPPIIKSYASQNKQEMFSLIYNGSRLTFFLMWILLLPLIFKIDLILNLWLKNVPIESIIFSQLALIETLIVAISMPLTTAARAPGNMKIYELVLGTIQLLILPVSWFILSLGGEAYSVFIVAIIFNIIIFFIRLYIVNWLIELPIIDFFKKVVFPVILVVFFSSLFSIFLNKILSISILFDFIFIISCFLINGLFIYMFGLDKDIKLKISQIVKNIVRKN